MKKIKRRLRTRICSLGLIASMLVGLLPMSAIIVLATENRPVAVTWAPQTQTEGGVRTVNLTASLTAGNEDEISAAMVEIVLEAGEASALQWDGASIDADGLQGEEPEQPEEGTISGEEQTPDSSVPTGEADDSDTNEGTSDSETDVDSPATGTDVEEPNTGETGENDSSENGSGEEISEPDASDPDAATDGGASVGDEPTGSDPVAEDPENSGDKDGVSTDDPLTEDPDVIESAAGNSENAGKSSAQNTDTFTENAETGESISLVYQDPDSSAESSTGAVLITNADGTDGAVLRILLVGDSQYTKELTFQSETELEVAVEEGDIRVQTYSTENQIPSVNAEPLLGTETGNQDAAITTQSFTVYESIPAEVDVSTQAGSIDLEDELKGGAVTYKVSIQKPSIFESNKQYSFTISLPDSLSLPEGELTAGTDENGIVTIQCGGTEIAALGLPDGVKLPDGFSVEATDNGFTFTVTAPWKPLAEGETYDFSLTLQAGNLVRSTEAVSGKITLTVSAVKDESEKPATDSASVTVTAGEDVPGQGGWTVAVTDSEPVTQPVFWADNNNEDKSRPNWSGTLGDTASGMTPKLYYTLTEVDAYGNPVKTFQPVELTEETLRYVGLTDMPTVSESGGVLSVTVDEKNGLPSRLVEQADTGDVNRHYTVSWSLEPPESIPGDYTLQDIEDPALVDGVSKPGWYFVLLRDFTITVDVKQGIAAALTPAQVLDLLDNFTFHWEYDSMPTSDPGKNTLEAMLEDGLHAEYADGELTVSGLWKYSLNGGEIIYSLRETENDGENDDIADGVLSEEELPESVTVGTDAPLKSDDWYNILYNNTGVPNHGTVSDAVYSGGRLTLIRGGETAYTAYKVWRDAYAQNENDNRPTTTFTLYRYLRAEGINTASVYTDGGVEVRLVWVEPTEAPGEAPPEGSSEGGGAQTPAEGHWEIRVVSGDEEDPAVLPRYDSQSGGEWIYVVKETLSGNNAGSYEQVFGKVEWDAETNEWDKVTGLDDLAEWGAERAGNAYLYNDDTLTNLQTGTVSVGATKEWKAATFQSSLNDVVVELTLQVREKNSEDSWKNCLVDGKAVTRYLCSFSAVQLTDSLAPGDTPAMEQYRGGDRTKELEYRWVETAVYTGINEEEVDVEITIANYTEDNADDIKKHPVCHTDWTAETGTLTGTFKLGGTGTWTVEYEQDDTGNITRITNSVEDTVDYEVVKEWHAGTEPTKITLQIFRVVTGEAFDYEHPYLEFTMDGTSSPQSVEILNEDNLPEDAEDVGVTWGIEDYTSDQSDDCTSWPAVVTGLPAYDDEGRTYEYILLEKAVNGTPVYRNEETDTADYRTVVVNGDGPGGFNLLIRKTWLDNSDTPHREPVTFTLYNKNTDEPVKKTDGNPYTIPVGGDNIWSSVFWVANDALEGGDSIDADDVYLVETSVGLNEGDHLAHKVEHYLGESGDEYTYEALYGDKDAGTKGGYGKDGHIFDVTTENHRYQVTYEAEYNTAGASGGGQFPGGIGAAFTITNRRLGSIDLTVNKTWIDGRAARDGGGEQEDPTLSQEIADELKKIAETKGGKQLALVFRLVFDESMDEGNKDNWEITRSGPGGTDTVCVGGEPVDILGQNREAVSSDQVIIGVTKNDDSTFTTVTNDNAYFFNLPKYDAQGNVVSYSVEEIWLDVTDPEDIKKVDLGELEKKNSTLYGGLYELWSGYTDPEFKWTYTENADGQQHTKDVQTLSVTNRRGTPKTVEWTKVWKDAYTNESGLRPDLYLDIYRVVHVPVKTTSGEGESQTSTTTYQRQIEYYGSSGDWEKEADTWKLTLDNVPAFDSHGFEIYYYAVERTAQPASQYDYQAGKYSLNGEQLGTRDEPAERAGVLSDHTEQASNDHAYALLVLGKRAGDTDDNIDSIQWAENYNVQGTIGIFGEGGSLNYAKYALIEGGTFTNTLAESYSIDGMKYWTNLPAQWDMDSRLPGVRFLVYRYTQSNKDEWNGATLDSQIKDENGTFKEQDGEHYEFAAELTISSDQWKDLRSGNGYRYLIQYNGVNNLTVTEENGLTCNGTDGSAPLERYNENGELYTYEIREVVQWPEGVGNVQGSDVFTVSQAANGFYFTNDYDPAEGSIQVKKFLYLPMEENDQPEAYPAVTFKLTRQVTYDGKIYEPDRSFRTQTVTIKSSEVQTAWESLEEGHTAEYVTLEKTFENLPLYAPNGWEYRYTVIEDRDELKGYETWAVSGDVEKPDNVAGEGKKWTTQDTLDYPNAGITDGIKIENLTPVPDENKEEETAAETLDAGTTEETAHAATFKNRPDNPPETYEGHFTATKIWDDNNNAYGFRPTVNEFEEISEHVETDESGKVIWTALKREAKSQTGEANQMSEYLIASEDYTLTVEDKENGMYVITITPKDSEAFELYAPNGMPWVYSFSEPVTDNNRLQIDFESDEANANKIYAPPAETGGTWTQKVQPTTGDMQNTSFGSLTNTTHMEYKFNKVWVDEDGKPITENYLGEDFWLTVSFQLQVSDDGKVEWSDANEYFASQKIDTSNMEANGNGVVQGTGDAWDTATITAAVDDAVWDSGGTFTKLPTVLKDGDEYILLQYRVIEASVSYGKIVQEIKDLKLNEPANNQTTGSYTVENEETGLVTGATFSRQDNAGVSTSTNQLSTTSVSVTKVWNDTNNQYGTRPGAEAPWTWGSWFVLQRATDADGPADEDAEWKNVAVFKKLYGGQESSAIAADDGNWTAEITGLPTADYSTGTAKPYTYRVRELQPRDGGYASVDSIDSDDIVEDKGIYNTDGSQYIASYEEGSQKDWTVTNALDLYIPEGEVSEVTATKQWAVPDIDTTPRPAVTFQLQYKTDGGDWTPTNFENTDQIANEENNWTVRWENLPDTIGGQTVTYRVVELDGNGWVQINQPVALLSGEEAAYTFTNTLSRDYIVEKEWNPASADTQEVTLWLYRTTDPNEIGSISGSRVPVSEIDSGGGYREAVLSDENDWRKTFQNLPKYNANSQLYYYYALELDSSGNHIPQHGKITQNGTDYEVSYGWDEGGSKTTVTNTTATGLNGTKTWEDNGNAYQTRPDSLKLILERRVGSSREWENVSNLYSPTWTKPETGNVWTYTYTGLPSCDENGNLYTYRVREEVLDGYEQTETTGNNFINVLSEKIDIVGQKVWSGETGETPGLTLWRRTSSQAEWAKVTGASPSWNTDETPWTFTYTNLPKYDASGVLYEYQVREDVPDGYEAGYKDRAIEATITGHPATTVDGLTITNYQDGNLTVRKTVSGNRGDPDKEFHFTVTLTGNSSAGTAANTVGGDFDTIRTNADGDATSSTLNFTDGESAEFTLKHGESLTIQGLPAGISYQVTETERGQDGYTTTGTGWNGTIPAGSTAKAKFDNYSHDSGGGGGDDDRFDLTGRKTWVDKGENDPKRPEDITLELYRKTADGSEERVYAEPTWVKNGNIWTYTFHDLPERDENGNRYTYWVHEVVPEGYESSQSGNNITNRSTEVEPGSLRVTKQVTGSRGDPTREFTFTVTLSNRNLTGIYGQMAFIDGVATFTLHSGETILAENLPAGITYTVTEAEANQDGYTTTAVGDTGTIAADTVASAVFTNDRPRHDRPDEPDEPDPEYPDEPGKPDYPDEPDRPDEPDYPDEPDTPDNPDIPRTDDPTRNDLLAMLCLASFGGMVLLGLLGLVGGRIKKKYRGKRLR